MTFQNTGALALLSNNVIDSRNRYYTSNAGFADFLFYNFKKNISTTTVFTHELNWKKYPQIYKPLNEIKITFTDPIGLESLNK